MTQTEWDFDKVYSLLFDQEKDPLLVPGYVGPGFEANQAQLSAAVEKLRLRRAQFGWRLLNAQEELTRKIAAAFAAAGKTRTAPDVASAGLPSDTAQVFPLESLAEQWQSLPDQNLVACKPLPFYPQGWLVHIEPLAVDSEEAQAFRFVVADQYTVLVPLDGRPSTIHMLNKRARLNLGADNCEEYLSFYCDHYWGEDGPFLLVEEDEAQQANGELPGKLYIRTRDLRIGCALRHALEKKFPTHALAPSEQFPRATIGWPLTAIPPEPDGRMRMLGTVVYANDAFRAAFAIDAAGNVEMLADALIQNAALAPMDLAWAPSKTRDNDLRHEG